MDIITHTLEKKIPFAVQFNLTRRCNLRCIHCCVGKRNGSIGNRKGETDQELGLAEIGQILEQLAEAGCLVLTLSGGEVLLRKDLIDIVRCARKLNFVVKIFTNGTFVGEKEAKAFRRLHIQQVHVSLYAAKAQVHDEISGITGSWEKTVEGIRLLRGAGIPVKIKCAIMQQNVGEYREVYNLAMNLGATYAFDPLITARDDGSKDTLKYRILLEDLQKIFQDSLFQGEGKIERIENLCCSSSEIYNEVPCSAAHNICFISPEGEVTPCVQLPVSCGNLRDYDFEWIWRSSPEMLRIRQIRMKDVKGCEKCQYLLWCARCPGLAYLEDGDLLGPSSAACWMTRAMEKVGFNRLYDPKT